MLDKPEILGHFGTWPVLAFLIIDMIQTHRGAAVRVQAVRHAVPDARQREAPHAVAHGRETLRVRRLRRQVHREEVASQSQVKSLPLYLSSIT